MPTSPTQAPISDEVSAPADGRPWTHEELRAAVDAYLEMLDSERAKRRYVKTEVYRALAERFHRTAKAFEYRMQNISYVLALMGRDWLPGLKPARNVGANGVLIEQFINEREYRTTAPVVEFELDVRDRLKRLPVAPPAGNARPEVGYATVAQVRRDPAVKAWVLAQARGTCECCGNPARAFRGRGRIAVPGSPSRAPIGGARARRHLERGGNLPELPPRIALRRKGARACRTPLYTRAASRSRVIEPHACSRAEDVSPQPASAPPPRAKSGSRPRDNRRRGAKSRRPGSRGRPR